MKRALALVLTTALTTPLMAAQVRPVLTVPLEAEITGLTTFKGDLFVNYQHPAEGMGEMSTAGVGVVPNFDLSAEMAMPEGDEKKTVKSSLGTWQALLRAGQDGAGVIDGKTSDSPDFNSFIATGDNEGFLFTNWEERLGGMSRTKLTRAHDGTWTVVSTEMLDFSSVNGTWVNCFGSTSPWNTPLSAEELYFDNTADWNDPSYKYHQQQLDLQSHIGGTFPNPYDYGYIVEITDPTGAATPVKHKTMGRYSHENGFVMPDQKTVYLSDDGTNVVFFKFVADTAGDLSAGTLFAAKVTQNGDAGSDTKDVSFDIDWIELGHSDNATIETWVRSYDGITPEHFGTDKTYITDEDVAAWAAGSAKDDRVAFLESRKAAAAKGATAEFRKMEGVAFDGKDVFLAMTDIGKGMADDKGDIQLAKNPCGAVFKVALDGSYNATSMEPYVVGGPFDEAAAPNACAIDNISSPDNVLALAEGVILIGEDSGDHENNTLWIAQ